MADVETQVADPVVESPVVPSGGYRIEQKAASFSKTEYGPLVTHLHLTLFRAETGLTEACTIQYSDESLVGWRRHWTRVKNLAEVGDWIVPKSPVDWHHPVPPFRIFAQKELQRHGSSAAAPEAQA